MGRLLKLLVYLIILGFLGLVGYAYLGPYFGVDFRAETNEMRVPVSIDVD